MADGTIRIFNSQLRSSTSSILSYPQLEPLSSPYLHPLNETLLTKTFLQHQPWAKEYVLAASPDNVGEEVSLLLFFLFL